MLVRPCMTRASLPSACVKALFIRLSFASLLGAQSRRRPNVCQVRLRRGCEAADAAARSARDGGVRGDPSPRAPKSSCSDAPRHLMVHLPTPQRRNAPCTVLDALCFLRSAPFPVLIWTGGDAAGLPQDRGGGAAAASDADRRPSRQAGEGGTRLWDVAGACMPGRGLAHARVRVRYALRCAQNACPRHGRRGD